MQPDPCAGFFVSWLFLLVALKLILGMSGVFHGFWPGFWAGFFDRLFVGSRRPGTSGPIGCLVLEVFVLLSMGCIGPILSLLLSGLAGPNPGK